MGKRLLLMIVAVLSFAGLRAQSQSPRRYHYVELKPHFGEPIIYSDSLSSTLNKSFFAGDIRWGTQTNGERDQDQYLAFPVYGIGLYHAYLSSPDTLGRPWAAYFFYSGPILRIQRFSINYEIALGVAWNFSKWDPETNNKNDLIGSAVNAYFNGGLQLKYRLSNRLDIGAAIDFTHFSNGAMQTPNKGMNLRGYNISMAYNFNTAKNSGAYTRPEIKTVEDKEKVEKSYEINLTTAIGGKATTTEYGTGPIYFTSSVTADFVQRYHWIGKLGAGLDWFTDNSISEDYTDVDHTPYSKYMFIGVHLSHELIISKISALTQAGTYLWKGTDAKGWFFFRLHLKYHFHPDWYLAFGLKTANGFKADYIEWGLGHRFKL
jgi:hypothetical protein